MHTLSFIPTCQCTGLWGFLLPMKNIDELTDREINKSIAAAQGFKYENGLWVHRFHASYVFYEPTENIVTCSILIDEFKISSEFDDGLNMWFSTIGGRGKSVQRHYNVNRLKAVCLAYLYHAYPDGKV